MDSGRRCNPVPGTPSRVTLRGCHAINSWLGMDAGCALSIRRGDERGREWQVPLASGEYRSSHARFQRAMMASFVQADRTLSPNSTKGLEMLCKAM